MSQDQPSRHRLHEPQQIKQALLSNPADDAPATYLWSKPKRGRCRRCRLPIIWIYTEREAPWPFQPEEYESAGLPPKAQWRLPRRRKIIAIQRPAERPPTRCSSHTCTSAPSMRTQTLRPCSVSRKSCVPASRKATRRRSPPEQAEPPLDGQHGSSRSATRRRSHHQLSPGPGRYAHYAPGIAVPH